MKTEQGTVRQSLENADAKTEELSAEKMAWFFLAKAAVQALCAIADAITLLQDEEI